MHGNSLFKPEYCAQADMLCKLGATDEQMAEFFDVCVATIYNWKNDHPEFLEATKNGKIIADMEVASALYRKATSGDTTSCIFWLKNRQPEYWRDRTESTNTTINVVMQFEDYIRSLNGEATEQKVLNGTVAKEASRVEAIASPVRNGGVKSDP